MASNETQTVVVGVTGCIAAYKACELVRALMREGCRVKVVMTENATRFVGSATFRALTGEPVAVSLWDEPAARVHHISLAEEADVFVVAPATANVIAKLASGRADDLLTTTALATEAPLVIAPAMNVHMWRAEATQANVAALRARGAIIVEPESGELACGDVGEGRLAEVESISATILAETRRSRDLDGVNVLVTAGGTQEPIDPVRFIGNRSSGKTGYAIAEEAVRRGASVTLVSGPSELPDPFGVAIVRVSTAAEMASAVDAAYGDADAVIAAAAVADFRPAAPSQGKVKKADAPSAIALAENPDILAGLGARKEGRLLVGFAAETGEPVAEARRKLETKNLDFVVGNDVSSGVGFGTDDNKVWLVSASEVLELPRMSKRMLARELLDRISSAARSAADSRRGVK
jgi:phosphopantothenoylcysteine decarboxylase/phosphopantothenate--cysteine ligase